MPYSTTVSGLDFSGGVPDVRVTAGYSYHVVGGPHPGEHMQDQVNVDIPTASFTSTAPATFSYAGNLAPVPSPTWFIGLWIQEIPRIANGTGWLFRTGGLTTEPPPDPIEVILAPESFVGAAELRSAVGSLPIPSGSTTITGLALSVAGADISLAAFGTDTALPAGVTFTYTATMILLPSGRLMDDSPFDIRLSNGSLGFTSGPGTGASTALLNLVSGIILGEVSRRIKDTLKGRLNSGVLSDVATRLNKGVPSTMPPGVVLSIRSVRATTRTTAAGPESVIGIRAALGAFGGVSNKFPPLVTGCFIATASTGPHSAEVKVLRAWRDRCLRTHRAGRLFIDVYERLSPQLARMIAVSPSLRAIARLVLVRPAAYLASQRITR